jgi:hypothetical protein
MCEICSMPLADIQWTKNDNFISNDRVFHIKTHSKFNDNEECLITTLTNHVNFFFERFFSKKKVFCYRIHPMKDMVDMNVELKIILVINLIILIIIQKSVKFN